ncbi:hypothetical protein M407DRAFT_139689 [Tulasnella calospora MUT 4182]|uniref:Uncharacterized protein n=1 Tax=Tulasnella calospora MUT 4182 TaxID=1051891 RepID=A0A0C3LFM2_9AGAM|nr:hypothetical protein M407DRAFT_139689 [Tulasnella calospora MUT 4182]
MNNTIQTVLEVSLPPDKFGQDGGKFYRAYDALAQEIDGDMVARLKEHLDGILIFAQGSILLSSLSPFLCCHPILQMTLTLCLHRKT